MVAPEDLFIFCISPLEAVQKGAQQKGMHACMCVYICVCDVLLKRQVMKTLFHSPSTPQTDLLIICVPLQKNGLLCELYCALKLF